MTNKQSESSLQTDNSPLAKIGELESRYQFLPFSKLVMKSHLYGGSTKLFDLTIVTRLL
ncbi:hypothetical protein [Celerinatantimonas sp. MCCC 1A17872]|uniref:hypothetical protein n=1 Tax=Celerinatantimonas sp. MCCC 1A17872 TaxID=3177514 RepID=UPI0038CA674F